MCAVSVDSLCQPVLGFQSATDGSSVYTQSMVTWSSLEPVIRLAMAPPLHGFCGNDPWEVRDKV